MGKNSVKGVTNKKYFKTIEPERFLVTIEYDEDAHIDDYDRECIGERYAKAWEDDRWHFFTVVVKDEMTGETNALGSCADYSGINKKYIDTRRPIDMDDWYTEHNVYAEDLGMQGDYTLTVVRDLIEELKTNEEANLQYKLRRIEAERDAILERLAQFATQSEAVKAAVASV